jgi:hypothetical protein
MEINITTAAMLSTLNMSVWEARKQDKKTAGEVAAAKGARSKRAATVHKHLFSECPALEAIKSLRSEARVWFNTHTLPWDDNGRRMVTLASYIRVTEGVAKYEARFNALVQAFLNMYATEISKQAFEMGSLFDRSEYPPVEEVAAKFRFSYCVEPLPDSGDFRVDIGNEAARHLASQYETAMQQRVAGAMADAWERVKTQVEWVQERMTAVLEFDPDAKDDDGKKARRPKIYDSMLENGMALTALLRDLNVTNDPRLEEARRQLESTLGRLDIESLRESVEVQRSTLKAMEDIRSKFDL